MSGVFFAYSRRRTNKYEGKQAHPDCCEVFRLFQLACVGKIGQQRRIATGEEVEAPSEDYPEAQRWVRVVFSVMLRAETVAVRDLCDMVLPMSPVSTLPSALRAGCWALIDAPLRQDESQETRLDNDEKRQVQALYDVLEDAWQNSGRHNFYGDVRNLIFLLRRLCLDVLHPSWRPRTEIGS